MSRYVQGSAARQLQPAVKVNRQPVKVSNATRRNREKAQHMNASYVLFLVVALALIGIMSVFYINLQSEVTNSVKHIAALERTYNNLKDKNQETYTRVTSDVDLEEIKQIAMGQLGMIYAKEGQIESFSSEDSDYVRQLADIPVQ